MVVEMFAITLVIAGSTALGEQTTTMTESQVDRIKKAEKVVRELVELAAQIRQEAAKLPIENPALRNELLETVEGFETQAQDLRNTLQEWREDIH